VRYVGDVEREFVLLLHETLPNLVFPMGLVMVNKNGKERLIYE